METVRVTSCDGASVELSVLAGEPGRPVVLVWPAMGVPARYYAPLGERLQAVGMSAVLCELRGMATSSVRPTRRDDFGVREMLEFDYPVAVDYARRRFVGSPVVFWGHSLGGQLACLHQGRAAAGQRGDALVLTATCSVYHRAYGFPASLAVLVGTQLARAIGTVVGHFPGHRLGFGGLQARALIRDWAHQGRTGRYEPRGMHEDLEARLSEVDTPTLAVSFEGDRFAPGTAVDHLVGKLAPTAAERWHLAASDLGAHRLDHFSWVKTPEALVARVTTWLDQRLQGGRPGASATAH